MITIELKGLVNVKELKREIRKNDNGWHENTDCGFLCIYLSFTDDGNNPTITVDKAIQRWNLDEFVPKYGVSIADHVHHSGKLTRSKWRTNYDIKCKTINEKIILDDIIRKRLYMDACYFPDINLYTLRAVGQSEPADEVDAEGFIRVHGTSEQIATLSSTTCDIELDDSCSFDEYVTGMTKSIAQAVDVPVSMFTTNGRRCMMTMIESDFIIYCKGFNKKIVFEVANRLVANIKFDEEKSVYRISNGCKDIRFMTADAFVYKFGTADQLEQYKACIRFGNPFQVFNDDGLSNVNTSRQLYHQMIGRGLRTKDSVTSDHSLPSDDMTETLRRRSKLLLAESTYGLQSTKTMKRKQAAGKIAMANDLKSPNAAMIENDGVETQHVPTSKVMDDSVDTGLRMIVNSDLLGSH